MPYYAIDLHCDSVSLLMKGRDLHMSLPDAHVDLPRLREGRVGLEVFAVYVPPKTETDKAFSYATERLDAIDAFIVSDESLAPVETASELRSCLAAGKTGIMKAVENGLAIENSLEKLELLRKRNVRIMTLVHSAHLPWVASCTGDGPFTSGAQGQGGLSDFGGTVVDAMNDLGIIPDVSHSSEAAFWDVIRRSKRPIIASHSCAWNLCGAARNLKDDQLKALGDSGGVAGVNFFSAFLSEPYRLAYEPLRMNGRSKPNISVAVPQTIIADHIDYMVNMAGEDCVALGSDFDGVPATPDGVTGCGFFPVLEEELRSRGYSEKRIEKIFNENFLRVLDAWN